MDRTEYHDVVVDNRAMEGDEVNVDLPSPQRDWMTV
jgi:hypothetical protein